MTVDFVTHDPSGLIHAHGSISTAADLVDATLAAQVNGTGLSVLRGTGTPATHYVDNGQLRPRPVLPVQADRMVILADGHDAATLSGLPAGTVAALDGTTVTVAAGTLAVTTTLPATHQVALTCWPYQDTVVEITAHAP